MVSWQNSSRVRPAVLNLLAFNPIFEWVKIFDLRGSETRFIDGFRLVKMACESLLGVNFEPSQLDIMPFSARVFRLLVPRPE